MRRVVNCKHGQMRCRWWNVKNSNYRIYKGQIYFDDDEMNVRFEESTRVQLKKKKKKNEGEGGGRIERGKEYSTKI